jgi:ribosomal protein S18 acetylase RimI-like enzyme
MLAPSVSSMLAGGIEDRGSRIEDRGSRIADRGSRIEDRGLRSASEPAADGFALTSPSRPAILDPRSAIPDPQSAIPDPRSSIPDPQSAIPDPRSAIPDPRSAIRPVERHHRATIEALLRATQSFRENEIKVALEVIDTYLIHPEEDYAALGAFTPGGELLGYVCYGPTPCTVGTWDLYWIAVTPAAQGTGVGTMLLQEVERRLGRADARLVIIETSSLPSYAGSREFYQRRGYEVVARVPDFYAQGDDRLIFAKRIHN